MHSSPSGKNKSFPVLLSLKPGEFQAPWAWASGILLPPACPSPSLPHLGYSPLISAALPLPYLLHAQRSVLGTQIGCLLVGKQLLPTQTRAE